MVAQKGENKEGPESIASDGKGHNVGAGPAKSIADGGHGESKQGKEHTGGDTEMGGAAGGEPGLGDASEGNDNTPRE